MRLARILVAVAIALPLAVLTTPATAHESVLGAELYPVVGSGPATFISGWTHFHPRADLGGGCSDDVQIKVRLKLEVSSVSAQELVTRSVTLEWRARTGGNFAGYALYSGTTNYAGGRTADLGDPAVQKGHHQRTYPISKTVRWEKYGKAYWLENFSFEGESFEPDRRAPSFPEICRSHSILFHIIRTNPGGGDGGCLVTGFGSGGEVATRTNDQFPTVPVDKC